MVARNEGSGERMRENVSRPIGGGARRGALLVAVLAAVFAVPLSVSGTAVALADIAASLGESAAGQQWALNGFNITFAASTLAWGSLADRVGRRPSFQAGAILFIAGSVLSVLAESYVVLDAARILAGLGAGAVFSVGSALLSVVYAGEGRARVFSLLGAMAGLALAFGPTLCGIIAQTWTWRAIFGVQGGLLVVSFALMQAARPLLRDEPRSTAPFDWPAAILFFAAIASLVAALVTGSEAGWASAPTLGLALIAAFAFAALLRRERRAEHPLLDLALIRQPRFLGVTLVVAVASFTFAAGAVVSAWLLVPAMVMLGAGFGLHAGLVDNEGLAAAPDEDAGMAAGWINTMRVGTEAVAVSLFGAVFIPALGGGGEPGAGLRRDRARRGSRRARPGGDLDPRHAPPMSARASWRLRYSCSCTTGPRRCRSKRPGCRWSPWPSATPRRCGKRSRTPACIDTSAERPHRSGS
ncbi:Putative transmembrane efflux protein [Gulosibacter sp. 10]|nr:Putative transmembrane efflux protein [Gulosibacter sp. 10]